LALDDFGVGFSSLSRLQRLPVDELKIDRSFVQGLRAGSSDALLVHSIVELAHRLGLRVVAEGVEEMEPLRLLQGFGCDVVQGYLVSPPLAPEALAAFCRFRQPTPGRRALAKVASQAPGTPRARSASA
jgi:EAL domain-containing protein (putative c-di-GMP-specific phosphodiesterase class I)